ncbi:hypothetical protein H0H92_003658 [Tricholoma furcatifolium]|nr:hypothetical protein H0H92_003658 [Tricholoma furcatifolium]
MTTSASRAPQPIKPLEQSTVADLEPDHAWKESLRKRIEAQLSPMVTDTKRKFHTEASKLSESSDRYKALFKEYEEAMDHISTLLHDSYEGELERERQARRWAAGVEMPTDALVQEQQKILDQIKGARKDTQTQNTPALPIGQRITTTQPTVDVYPITGLSPIPDAYPTSGPVSSSPRDTFSSPALSDVELARERREKSLRGLERLERQRSMQLSQEFLLSPEEQKHIQEQKERERREWERQEAERKQKKEEEDRAIFEKMRLEAERKEKMRQEKTRQREKDLLEQQRQENERLRREKEKEREEKEEAERREREETDRREREDAERREREDAERREREDAERREREDAERREREDAERKEREEKEKAAKEEEERQEKMRKKLEDIAREEEERKQAYQDEQERTKQKAQAALEHLAKLDAVRKMEEFQEKEKERHRDYRRRQDSVRGTENPHVTVAKATLSNLYSFNTFDSDYPDSDMTDGELTILHPPKVATKLEAIPERPLSGETRARRSSDNASRPSSLSDRSVPRSPPSNAAPHQIWKPSSLEDDNRTVPTGLGRRNSVTSIKSTGSAGMRPSLAEETIPERSDSEADYLDQEANVADLEDNYSSMSRPREREKRREHRKSSASETFRSDESSFSNPRSSYRPDDAKPPSKDRGDSDQAYARSRYHPSEELAPRHPSNRTLRREPSFMEDYEDSRPSARNRSSFDDRGTPYPAYQSPPQGRVPSRPPSTPSDDRDPYRSYPTPPSSTTRPSPRDHVTPTTGRYPSGPPYPYASEARSNTLKFAQQPESPPTRRASEGRPPVHREPSYTQSYSEEPRSMYGPPSDTYPRTYDRTPSASIPISSRQHRPSYGAEEAEGWKSWGVEPHSSRLDSRRDRYNPDRDDLYQEPEYSGRSAREYEFWHPHPESPPYYGPHPESTRRETSRPVRSPITSHPGSYHDSLEHSFGGREPTYDSDEYTDDMETDVEPSSRYRASEEDRYRWEEEEWRRRAAEEERQREEAARLRLDEEQRRETKKRKESKREAMRLVEETWQLDEAAVEEAARMLKVKEDEIRRQELETRRKAEELRKKEAEAKRKAEEVKRKEEEARRQAEEAKRKEEEARIKAEEARRKEEEVRRKEEEARKKEEEARIKAEEARRKEEEARKKEEEVKRKEVAAREEARRVREENWLREQEMLHREQELRKREEELQRREEEIAAQKEAERREKEEEVSRREAERLQRQFDAEDDARRQEEQRKMEERFRYEQKQEEFRRREQEIQERKRQDSTGSFPSSYGSSTSSSTRTYSASSATGAGVNGQNSGWTSASSKASAQAKANSTASASSASKPRSGSVNSSFPASTPSPHPPPSASEEAEWKRKQEEFSQEQQERFRKEQQRFEESRQRSESNTRLNKEQVAALLERHDRQWSILLTTTASIHWESIPWPMLSSPRTPDDITLPAITAYMQSPLLPDKEKAKSQKDRLKEHIRKWHPDRFETKCLPRVVEDEREKVKEGTGTVIRSLNELLQRANAPSPFGPS